MRKELRNWRNELSSWREELRKIEDFKSLSVPAIAQATSISQLQQVAARYRLHGFNGQILRTAYLSWLYKELGCTSFVETGTRWGYTAITARQLLGGPVFSVELMYNNYWHAVLLSWLVFGSKRGLRLHRGDSRAMLRDWLTSDFVGQRPMIYLDAHFFEDHPLISELEIAIRSGNCVIVIDDFKVPHDMRFGWDDKKGFEVRMESISAVLPKDRIRVLYPKYSADAETGCQRGTVVLLIDLLLPPSKGLQFPGTLFDEVS